MKSLLSFLLMTLLPVLSAVAASNSTFPVKPFLTSPSNEAEIKAGLDLLYRGQKETGPYAQETFLKAQDFQKNLYQILNQAAAQTPNWPYTIESRVLTGGFVKETTIRFASVIQRAPGHPANVVVARLYEPMNYDRSCVEPLPTTIFLHHILNEVPKIEEMAKMMAAAGGIVSAKMNVAVIHFPLFGDRTQPGEEFLTADLQKFQKSLAQTILDTRMLKTLLETLPNVRQERISLSGISLGAVLGLTIGAFDQSYYSYGFLVGGADMANVLMNRVRTRPNSEVAEALKSNPRSEQQLRHELAAADGYTWVHRFQKKKLFLLNATRDDIIRYDVAVEPLVEILKQNRNQVSQKINDDEHTPKTSAFNKFKDIFLPLTSFLTADMSTLAKVCPIQEPGS